jgi:PmbA protein
VEDIISQTQDGVLIEKFAWPEADPFTGRFALEVRCGLMISAGEVVGTVKNALLTGNMFEALRQVETIGADIVCTGNASVPTVSFQGMELVGN